MDIVHQVYNNVEIFIVFRPNGTDQGYEYWQGEDFINCETNTLINIPSERNKKFGEIITTYTLMGQCTIVQQTSYCAKQSQSCQQCSYNYTGCSDALEQFLETQSKYRISVLNAIKIVHQVYENVNVSLSSDPMRLIRVMHIDMEKTLQPHQSHTRNNPNPNMSLWLSCQNCLFPGQSPIQVLT